jgi:thiosulfate reductase cytochrome b subunit
MMTWLVIALCVLNLVSIFRARYWRRKFFELTRSISIRETRYYVDGLIKRCVN